MHREEPAGHPRTAIPWRIATERLLLRCWSPADAPRAIEAIGSSLDHLRRWMPWALQEPESLERKERRLRRFRVDLERGCNFVYGIFDPTGSTVLGGIGLHRRIGAGAGEMGYWMHAGSINRGLCTEAAAALVRVGFDLLGLVRIEIHCDPKNLASSAIPRKLGFTLQVIVHGRILHRRSPPRDSMIWALVKPDYPGTPAASAAIEAFDESGRRLL